MIHVPVFGYASGMAGHNVDCALGPWYLYYHPELWYERQLVLDWKAMIQVTSRERGLVLLYEVAQGLRALGEAILPYTQRQIPVSVIGGDHACAMGVWSAIAHAQRAHGEIGLIWIDAHMDSHTPITSKTKNIHGMPLAHLLGEGSEILTQLFDALPKLKPKHVCVVGVRSYEEEEAALLHRLGVKVFYMEAIRQRGLRAVLMEARDIVSQATGGFGISLDLDAVDPVDAPGVGYREPEGIAACDLLEHMPLLFCDKGLLGFEITEFNPLRDEDRKTALLVADLLCLMYAHMAVRTTLTS